MTVFKSVLLAAAVFLLAACQPAAEKRVPVDDIVERYVKLVLAVGVLEPGYVDAYYGPDEWQTAAAANTPDLATLQQEAADLQWALVSHLARTAPGEQYQRLRYLSKQLIAVETRVRMIGGETFTFDEETKLLFDAVVPPVEQADLDKSLADLDGLIDGDGTLQERFIRFNDAYVIPKDKLVAVFGAAIEACKAETEKFIQLPEGERFTSEFVTDKPWSGYNWYQGNAVSLIQVNTDLPSGIGSAVNLGCHEGYPGHHVFNAMLETNLVKARGWQEFSVYPLYSPQSLLAEGTASYGRFMAFPGTAQTTFEAEVLYPLAGLDPASAQKYSATQAALHGLRYARIEGARRYLDGKITRDELIDWLQRYQLISHERAVQGVKFIETYRGYVINYTLGVDLSAEYVARHGGTDHKARWGAYKILISTPLTASMLAD